MIKLHIKLNFQRRGVLQYAPTTTQISFIALRIFKRNYPIITDL